LKSLILIIDDDHNSTYLFEAIIKRLKRRDLNIRPIYDGTAAMQTLETETPTLIILDLGLPGVPGMEILDYIKRTPRLKHTRIIVITAYTDLARQINPRDVDKVLTKPVPARELSDLVASLLDR
jgi:CheY-like chemotaxis protein